MADRGGLASVGVDVFDSVKIGEAFGNELATDPKAVQSALRILTRARRDALLQEPWTRAVFSLAQGLKGMTHLADDKSDATRRLAIYWHQETFGSRIELATVLNSFFDAWKRVKFPSRQGNPEMFMKAYAEAARDPPADIRGLAEVLYPGSTRMAQVMSVCFKAHTLSEGKPWFVPCRMLAEALGLSSWTEPAAWLSQLRYDSIIKAVQESTQIRATRHIWIGPIGKKEAEE